MDSAFGVQRQRRKVLINIAPLIDVMFLLLIFFMVSSTFREEVGIHVELPASSTATELASEQHAYQIVVESAGTYALFDQSREGVDTQEGMTRQELTSALTARRDQANATFELKADEGSTYEHYIGALDAVKSAKIGRLVLRTKPEGAPSP